MHSSRLSGALIYALATVSGAAALAHETVWVRILADVFGTTAGAAAVVFASFMGGMGVGALVFGERSDRFSRPLALYGVLEIAAGLAAALVPLVVWLSAYPYGWLFRAAGSQSFGLLTALRIFLSALALLAPSVALGGTLPALVRAVAGGSARSGPATAANAVGRVYAFNTGGGVLGCALTGFLLVPGLGIAITLYLAAALSVGVGLAALLAARRTNPAAPASPPVPAADDTLTSTPVVRFGVPFLYGVSGFAALGLEVLWTRSLVFILRTTVYAFTSMLTVFILGLGIGGAVGAAIARRTRRPLAWFAGLEAVLAATVAAGLFVLRAFAGNWTGVDLALSRGWGQSALLHLAVSSAVMLVPTVLMGILFPVAARLHARSRPVGATTGELYFGNTVGSVLGSLSAGFILAPTFGTGPAILVMATVFLAVSAAAIVVFASISRALKVRALFAAVLFPAAAFVFVPTSATTELFAAPIPNAELVFVDEGANGTVTVHRYPGTGWHVLSVGGVQVAGEAPALRSTQILQGLIPALVHPRPRRVLQVGLGSAETARVALDVAAEQYTCVEISPGVVSAAAKYFTPTNRGVLDDERFTLALADGKDYLAHCAGTFDLILSESTYPFLSGSSGLYTRDYFERCRERLASGGLVSIWLPLDVPADGLKSILATFADVFPHVTLWNTNTYAYKHGLILGSTSAFTLDAARIDEALRDPRKRSLLHSIGVRTTEDFVSCLLLDADGVARYAGGAVLHTDDRPVLEYATSLRDGRSWRLRLADNMETMGRERAPLLAHVDLTACTPQRARDLRIAIVKAESRARRLVSRMSRQLERDAAVFELVERARAAATADEIGRATELYARAIATDAANDAVRTEFGHFLLSHGMVDRARALVPLRRGEAVP